MLSTKPGHTNPHPDPDRVIRELTSVLESTSFRGSKRCQTFLTFVVTNALEGNHEALKERNLAVEVFGRKADADLADDSIVRVGAREVRKRLTRYYVTEGSRDALRIDLPAGSYVPAFSHPIVEEPSPVALPVVIPEPPSPLRRRLWLALAAVITATLLVISYRFWSATRPTEFDVFWQPVFAERLPINIAVEDPIVYRENEVNGSPASAIRQSVTSFGGTVAVARVFALCAKRDRTARIRLASKLDFADLRDASTILIGGSFTNRWTLELTQGFRFRMNFCEGKPCVIDSAGKQRWVLNGKTEDGRSTDEFILISRLPHSQSGGIVIAGTGLTVNGTAEAGRILADPDTLIPVLNKLPSNWRDHNLQIVLHSRIVGDTPAAPELVASEIW